MWWQPFTILLPLRCSMETFPRHWVLPWWLVNHDLLKELNFVVKFSPPGDGSDCTFVVLLCALAPSLTYGISCCYWTDPVSSQLACLDNIGSLLQDYVVPPVVMVLFLTVLELQTMTCRLGFWQEQNWESFLSQNKGGGSGDLEGWP